MLHKKLEKLTKKEALINKETMNGPMELYQLLNIKTQSMNKGTNTNLANTTTPKDANPIEIRISLDIEVQTMGNPSPLTNRNLVINKVIEAYEEVLIKKVNL